MLFQKRYNSIKIVIKLLLIFIIYIDIFKFFFSESYPKLLSSDSIYEWHRDQTNERFCVWFNFTTNLLKPNFNDEITLCTHGTIGYSKYLFYYAKNWKSFISASLFIDINNNELGIFSLLSYLRLHHCSLEMKTYVSTHIVWIKSKEEETCLEGYQKIMNALSKNYFSSCKKAKNYFKYNSLLNRKSSNPKTIKKYPPNTLRNIARFGATTNFHLISDMENQFSENAASNLKLISKTLLKSNNATTAIVIRRFEYDEKEKRVPKNVMDLNEMIQNKKAFEFHHSITPEAHAIDNLKEWLDYSSKNNRRIKINFVPYKNYFWEPQLLVHSSHPYHFEGFPIRHTDQQTLPYQLCRAKINFAVISHVFSFHRGIKFKQTKIENQAQQASRETAKAVSKRFIRFLDYAYPKTKSICGEWKS